MHSSVLLVMSEIFKQMGSCLPLCLPPAMLHRHSMNKWKPCNNSLTGCNNGDVSITTLCPHKSKLRICSKDCISCLKSFPSIHPLAQPLLLFYAGHRMYQSPAQVKANKYHTEAILPWSLMAVQLASNTALSSHWSVVEHSSFIQ